MSLTGRWWRLGHLSVIAAAVGATLAAPAEGRVSAGHPGRSVKPSTNAVVPSRIEPSATVIPANTLRFYVYFCGNARGVFRQDQVSLVDAGGRMVAGAFMDFGQELWSADGTRLTLLIDPGRIKRGVTAGKSEGPVLRVGQRYRLTISWTDAAGRARSLARDYAVDAAELTALDVRAWSVDAPVAGTRSSLVILFDRPMDEALLEDSLAVIGVDGQAVTGSVAVERGLLWTFTPDAPWRAGRHRVLVMDRLEDISGNRVGEALDHEVGTALAGPRSTSMTFTPVVLRP